MISLVEPDQAREAREIQRGLQLPLGLTRPSRHAAGDTDATERPDTAAPTVAEAPAPTATDTPANAGTIRWFNPRKGYGFIARDGDDDVFLHASVIAGVPLRELRNGRRVAFEIRTGEKGRQARNVALV